MSSREQANRKRCVWVEFADGQRFLGWKAAAKSAGMEVGTLKRRKKLGQPPFGNGIIYKEHRAALAAHIAREEEIAQERRLLAIRHELVVCLLERLTQPGNEADALIAIGAVKRAGFL